MNTRLARSVLPCIAALLGQCAELDVCERGWPGGKPLNVNPTGDQVIGSPSAFVAFPNGYSFVAFRSPRGSNLESGPAALLGGFMDPSGTPVDTCEGDLNYRYDRLVERQSVQSMAVVAPAGDALGLLAYVVYDTAKASSQVFGQSLDNDGCAGVPFQISQEQEGTPCEPCASCSPLAQPDLHCIEALDVARIGANKLVAVWLSRDASATNQQTVLRARALTPDRALPNFEPTAIGLDNRAVDLSLSGELPQAFALAPFGSSFFALIWQEASAINGFRTMGKLYNDTLQLTGETEVDRGTQPPGATSVRVAATEAAMIVAWTKRFAPLTSRVYARILTGTDFQAGAPPTSRAFPVSLGQHGNESQPAVTVFDTAHSKWLLSWTTDRGDQDGSGVRALLIDDRGRPAFCNRACETRDFVLTGATEGSQGHSAIVATGDRVGVVYEERGGPSDREKAGIVGLVINRDRLIPEGP